MGCDIHPYVEVKSGDKWFYVGNAIDHNRNYHFFSVLAGVRSQGEEGFFELSHDDADTFAERNELSEFVASECIRDGQDGHSHIVCPYIDLQRLFKAIQETAKESGEDLHWTLDHLGSWLDACKIYSKVFDEVRVVVWFDN